MEFPYGPLRCQAPGRATSAVWVSDPKSAPHCPALVRRRRLEKELMLRELTGTFWRNFLKFSSCEDWLWSTVFRDGLWSYNEILVWWKVGSFGLWDLMTRRWLRLHGPPVMTVKLWSGWPRSRNLSEFPGRSKRQCLRSSTGKSPERREFWRCKMVEIVQCLADHPDHPTETAHFSDWNRLS